MSNKKIIIFLAIFIIVAGLGLWAYLFLQNNKYIVLENGSKILKGKYYEIIINDDFKDAKKNGDVERQIQIAESLATSSNKNKLMLASAYLDKASLNFKEQEYGNKALSLAEEVIKEEPNNKDAYLIRGYAYEILQDFEKALADYNKSIEIDSSNNVSYVKRGHLYSLDGNIILAEKDFKKAIELMENDEIAIMNLARIELQKSNFEKAFQYASKLISFSEIAYNKASGYEILGMVEMAKKDYQSAIEYFDNSILFYGNFYTSYVNRAYAKILLNSKTLAYDQGIQEEIKSDLEKALKINEKGSFALVVNGFLSEAIGNKDDAKQYYQKALDNIDADTSLGKLEKDDMKTKINFTINDLI